MKTIISFLTILLVALIGNAQTVNMEKIVEKDTIDTDKGKIYWCDENADQVVEANHLFLNLG